VTLHVVSQDVKSEFQIWLTTSIGFDIQRTVYRDIFL